jgi:acetaldehyde dehydrogenase (acetylating)
VLDERERDLLRRYVWRNGRLNVDQVGRSPADIAKGAGFSVPPRTAVLVVEADTVGREEPLSMETLSPILSFYTVDGWEAGCERCKEILAFGGIGHTLGLHCGNDRIIEAFALEKPAMRIVVNTVCALGAVGYTNRLFPAMTLGPGTLGGSITSDNISPLHLLNIKRLAFETNPIHPRPGGQPPARYSASASSPGRNGRRTQEPGPWMREVEERLRARAGNPPSERPAVRTAETSASGVAEARDRSGAPSSSDSSPGHPLSEETIDALIARFRRR